MIKGVEFSFLNDFVKNLFTEINNLTVNIQKLSLHVDVYSGREYFILHHGDLDLIGSYRTVQ